MKTKENNNNREMPHDFEAEKLVLGTIMTERSALDEVREILTPDTFYDEFHRQIYRAILAVSERGDRPDMVMVCNELRKQTSDFDAYRFALVAGSVSFDIYQHACLIHDKERRRRFYDIGQYLCANCFSEESDIVDVLSEARKRLDDVLTYADNNVATVREAVEGVYRQIDRNLAGGSALTGNPTGFREIDAKSGGLQKSDLVVIAAETSMGKTSLAIKMVMSAGCGVAFYSMEMKKEQIAARMMAIESGIPPNEILYGQLPPVKLARVDETVSRVLDREVYFDDRSTSNVDVILTSIRSMKLKYGISGVVIDYLQILNVNMKGSTKEQQMADVARRLKNLAKELDVWIIALSQLNRDSQNPQPSLNRLRDSGQIAEAADVVILIYRPEVYGKQYPQPFRNAVTGGTAMLDVAKGRNIGLLKLICGFDMFTTHFYEFDKVPMQREGEEEEPF